jgi:hypothetical protein
LLEISTWVARVSDPRNQFVNPHSSSSRVRCHECPP